MKLCNVFLDYQLQLTCFFNVYIQIFLLNLLYLLSELSFNLHIFSVSGLSDNLKCHFPRLHYMYYTIVILLSHINI